MKEWTRTALLREMEQGSRTAVMLYTPLCGTCKVAERMIDIALHLLPDAPVVKCNVNEMPDLCAGWQVTSVPCLIVLEQGEPVTRIYAIKSVDYVYQWLKGAFGHE